MNEIIELIEAKKYGDAMLGIEKLFEASEGDVVARTDLARLTYRIGQRARALEMFGLVVSMNPGHAYPVTHRAVLLLDEVFPLRTAGHARGPNRPAIQMSTLGYNGRFGNQINQYAFLSLSARAQGLAIRTPNWIGRYLFNLQDAPILGARDSINETGIDIPASLAGLSPGAGKVSRLHDLDVWGYFGIRGDVLRPFREPFQLIFQPAPWISPFTDGVLDRLEKRGRTVIAIHVRRGDMVSHRDYWVAPEEWYLEHLSRIWDESDRPVLYLASDEPSMRHAFQKYSPVVDNDLAHPLPGAEFFTDWFVLTKAHHVCISNSTFSYTAALVNQRCSDFFRPSRVQSSLIRFDPWMEEQLIER